MAADEKKFRRMKAVTERRQQEGIDKVLAGVLEAAQAGDMELGKAVDELRGLYVQLQSRIAALEANQGTTARASGIITLNGN